MYDYAIDTQIICMIIVCVQFCVTCFNRLYNTFWKRANSNAWKKKFIIGLCIYIYIIIYIYVNICVYIYLYREREIWVKLCLLRTILSYLTCHIKVKCIFSIKLASIRLRNRNFQAIEWVRHYRDSSRLLKNSWSFLHMIFEETHFNYHIICYKIWIRNSRR